MHGVHLLIYPRPAEVQAGADVTVDGATLATLNVPTPIEAVFPATFESACAALEKLGAFVEPDGSWAWLPTGQGTLEQLGGMIYEADDRLSHVEAEGQAGSDAWLSLLGALSGDGSHVITYVLPQGYFASADAFVEWIRQHR